MNAFDYFFENTSQLDSLFLIGKETISFKNLYETSLQLAIKLRSEIGDKKYVFLISVNNLFFLKTYLAILKSGNICIPLDPGIEKSNFDYITGKTHPALIFLTKDVKRKLSIDSFHCICPETIFHESPKSSTSVLDIDGCENDCAEIIFTSGSTGKPKGVMLSHKNLIANTNSILSYLNLSRDDRMLVVLPFYYCYGLSLLHSHLRAGGSLVFNNSFIFLGKVINDLLEYECTGFAGVPIHFQLLLRKSKSFKKITFPALKYVTQAGGKLATVFIDEFRDCFPEVLFYVMYGQTEATARLSYLPPEIYESKKSSIGKGIPGVKLLVVNDSGDKVEPGQNGEVIAHGDNVMIGYFADEKSTRNTVRNGWLYTGDLGTVDQDGFIYLTARSKEIIKIGGKRISPKEIESVIMELPEVIDCKIKGFDDEIQGEILKASIILSNMHNQLITEESIKQYCFKHLASYKVPRMIEFADQFILNSSGKKIN